MLIQFSVKNYKSFKEEQVFSMEAGTGDENIENIVTLNETNERILKTTALYGANASGKTNLISAFSLILRFCFIARLLSSQAEIEAIRLIITK